MKLVATGIGPLLFAAAVALGINGWLNRRSDSGPETTLADRAFGAALAAVLLLQFGLGLAQRQIQGLLLFHLLFGGSVALPLAVRVAVRCWLASPTQGQRWRGLALGLGILAQVTLGAVALLVSRGTTPGSAWLYRLDVAAHYGVGALLLGLALSLALPAVGRRRAGDL